MTESRDKIARFLYYGVGERYGIWEKLHDLTRHKFLRDADQILALLKQEGYVKLVTPQHLPLTDESKGYDLNLDQIRIVKQMWKDGWRRIEL